MGGDKICDLPLASCHLRSSAAVTIAIEGSKQQAASSQQPVTRSQQYPNLSLLCCLLGLLLTTACSTSSGESEIMRDLRKTNHLFAASDLVQTSYFLYPSTMRMVNIDDLPNWNGAIKDVRRLSLFSMWMDKFDLTKQQEVMRNLEEKENFSLYAEMEDKYSSFKLLGRRNGDEAVLFYNDSTVNYIVHLLGKVNYVKVIKLSADLQEAEKKGTGIGLLMDAMDQNTKRATQIRGYHERREKKNAEEQLRRDSIKAAEASVR